MAIGSVQHVREIFVLDKMDTTKEFVQIVELILNKFSLYMTPDLPEQCSANMQACLLYTSDAADE